MTHFVKIAANGKPAKANAKRHAAAIDTRTGLMWSAADACAPATLSAATEACEKLQLAGFTDWRLPTFEELVLLADRSRYNPAIDTDAFPTCKGGWYRTSTPAASSPSGFAWGVYFLNGSAYCGHQNSPGRVRAVRSVSAPAAGQ